MPISKLRSALNEVTQDKKITKEEWTKVVEPELKDNAPIASNESRLVARVWSNDKFDIAPEARNAMSHYLATHGYDVPPSRPNQSAARVYQALIASNVTETDPHFETLLAQTGRKNVQIPVAVLDNGFDIGHRGLTEKVWTNPKEIAGNSVDDDHDGKVDDVHGWDFVDQDNDPNALDLIEPESGGHGTHVAGIATQRTHNVTLMALRSYDDNALSGKEVAAAIDYAAKMGVRCINMSFKVATSLDVKLVCDAIARNPNLLVVASAGNDGRDLHSYNAVDYLKVNQFPNFAVVSAANQDGTWADYSNFGAPFSTHAATGTGVFSTIPADRFVAMEGTSMAAPNFMAVAARMLVLDEGLSPVQLKDMLTDTSTKSKEWKDRTAAGGLIDHESACRLAALTGLVRRGMSAEQAAQKIKLSAKDSARLLPLVSKYVSSS